MADHDPFITEAFLRTAWARDYEMFRDSDDEKSLLRRLENWSKRKDLKETSAEQAFIEEFFHDTWGYYGSGQRDVTAGFTSYPKFAVQGAGQGGGTGEADLALGWFERDGVPNTPQVLCEFKDIKSDLDAPQKRKGNNRSPVKQCIDYLSNARRGLFGNEPVLPTWAVVTDMNEFRLYWFDRVPQQYLRFVITPGDPLFTQSLLHPSEDGRLHRFLFWKVFQFKTLLTIGGKCQLEKLIARQWVREREIENTFYQEYRVFRDRLFKAFVKHNPDFQGTKGRLVRLAQKILDRCIFIFYCEDMGDSLEFPHQLLKEFLIHRSNDEYYESNGTEVWDQLKRLFKAMNTGGPFPPNHQINCFDGGLFEDDAELESLTIPNSVFCEKGQGQNEASLRGQRDTLLYLAATYNYAAKGDAQNSIGLYTLGRIFEQSITELEILEAEADGRESLNKVNKRKRDGVYYTPERVVQKIVQETLGVRITDLKTECGWEDDGAPSVEAAEIYWTKLQEIKIIDPACGSGAFLITCLQMLFTEYRATLDQLRRFKKRLPDAKDSRLIKDILARNLYGVDINPASAEITKLALWLHTARPGEKLSTLDEHIRDGNSLIDDTFYIKEDLEEYVVEERERINAFNWWSAFPEVEERGGFDVVVSNPPYVKLQNFRKVHEDMAEYLRNGRQGKSYYDSTQTGNFDIYLPFIEKGLALLKDGGRMGYIAPSLWTMNDYGLGLRRLLARTRQLDRWIDFGAYQVFEEAINYTALQFFTKSANDSVRISPAPDGDLSKVDWDDPHNVVPYTSLDPEAIWIFLSKSQRALIEKLRDSCKRLDHRDVTQNIFVGIQTSADSVYHLTRLGPGRYLCDPRGKDNPPYEVDIEDDLMKPLVSGPEAKRYLRPETDTYLLFPYEVADSRALLISQDRMEHEYPNAWKFLRSYESELRDREKSDEQKRKGQAGKVADPGKFDNDQWYRFGRHQNLDKQEIPCLIVAQTVPHLRVCYDSEGTFYLNNVRVNGIIPSDNVDGWFLLGVINGPVCDFVFRRTAAPKSGGYYEANRQYIAPLPIPNCDAKATRRIAEKARSLQEGCTKLLNLEYQRARRLRNVKVKSRPEVWIFPELGTLEDWLDEAPKTLDESEHLAWAKDRYSEALEARHEDIKRHFRPDALVKSVFEDGELKFLIDGQPVIDRIFLDEDHGLFFQAQWQQVADTFPITERTKGKALVSALRKVTFTENVALRNQVIDLQHKITQLRAEIWVQEKHLNELLYYAYGLTDDERRLVESG